MQSLLRIHSPGPMTMTHTNLDIAIVSWNTRDVLANCLQSVYTTARGVSCQVIVVDNASSDGSPQMVRERFPQARLIENRENVGFARANNQAIAASDSEFVLLLNSDTLVQPNALKLLVAFMCYESSAGVVGAYVLNPDSTLQASFGKFPTLASESIKAWGLEARQPFVRWFGPAQPFSAESVETDWVIGAAMMLRREAVNQVGLLDENYFMYSEEIDLAYRIKKAGWQNFVVRDARIIHLGGQSTRRMPASMKAELFRSKTRYFEKHHGRMAAAWVRTMFATSTLAKQWGYRLKGNYAQSQLWSETWDYISGKKARSEMRRANG